MKSMTVDEKAASQGYALERGVITTFGICFAYALWNADGVHYFATRKALRAFLDR